MDYINSLAYRDGLTGVKNKTAYLETIETLEKKIQSEIACFAIIVFDINNLKIINDSFGHAFGDLYISDCCSFICRIFKHSPVYRIGGDEFLVILEKDDFENREYLLKFYEEELVKYNKNCNPESKLFIAKGLSVFQKNDLCYDAVFERADTAMYENKKKAKLELLNSNP